MAHIPGAGTNYMICPECTKDSACACSYNRFRHAIKEMELENGSCDYADKVEGE